MKNYKKGFIQLISGVVVVIVFIGGLFYFYSKNKANSNEVIRLTQTPYNPNEETFNNTPGEIKSIKELADGEWSLDVDILSYNPKWTPGGKYMRYINQNPKTRNLIMNKDTKNHTCSRDGRLDEYKSNKELVGSFKESLAMYEREYKEGATKGQLIYVLDIRGDLITATYQQCSG